MAKHRSEEAYYERLRTLAQSNKPLVKESNSLGTLVDFKHAPDGVAYGIIKENHHYYVKKAGLKKNPNVSDFAYIGGLSNITEHQYSSLAIADKHRNMVFQTINETYTKKFDKNGGNKTKKGILSESRASQAIDNAESKLGDLDAATAAVNVPATPEPALGGAPEGEAEMTAGVEDMPADNGSAEMSDMGGEEGIPPMGGEEGIPPMGDEEGIAPEGEEGMGDEEGIAPEGEEGIGDDEEIAVEDPKDESTREIEKSLGKLTNKLRKTELTDPQVKSYVNSFLSAFKDKFPDIDIEDRKAMAEKITKVVPPEDIEDLGQNVEDSEGSSDLGIEEENDKGGCTECGGFAKYAESRGHDAESIQGCDDEEMTNMISGYANGHSEGENDGDFETIAIFVTPEILEKLRSDYGHNDFADEVEPFSKEMNESSDEDRIAKINELFGGLKNLGQKAGQSIKQGAQAIGQGISDKAGQVKQAVGQAATNVKQTYHAGELGGEVKKLEKAAANLGAQIGSLNKRMENAGGQPINVGSILTTIKNQVASGSNVNLSKFNAVQEEGIPVDSVEVQPNLEEDVTLKVGEKAGKALSPKGVPTKEMKESEEIEGEDIEDTELDNDDDIKGINIDALDVSDEDSDEPTEKEAPVISGGFQSLGGGVVKPDGAPTTIKIEPDKSVEITMNESERKLRKYVRNRLEEKAGLKKPMMNENKKSETLKKLDRVIDKQFGLHESVTLKKIGRVNEELKKKK